MPQRIELSGACPIYSWSDTIEETALLQLKNLARLPFIAPQGVAVMADVHAGKGSTIGSVIATEQAIIPAAVGVDIGCGMNAIQLSLWAADLPDNLLALRRQIERDIPLGAGGRHRQVALIEALQARLPIPDALAYRAIAESLFARRALSEGWQRVADRAAAQLGTLGSGNHFIELCIDEQQAVWVMLHSGSRGIGNWIGNYFITQAKRHMEHQGINLPDRDLAYLTPESEQFAAYLAAVDWAQAYALENRRVMMERILNALQRQIRVPFTARLEAINCHHNYVVREHHFGRDLWITRKGAIRAGAGELGIIPGSMGQCSYIVRGRGEPTSYCSCSHGAGRAMSRSAARRQFTIEDLRQQTEGVECRKDAAILDEIPAAYKPIDQVMASQTDLIDIVHTLKQVLCVKGT